MQDVKSYAVSFMTPEPKSEMIMPLSLPQAPKATDPDVRLVADNAMLEQENATLRDVVAKKTERLAAAEKDLEEMRKVKPKVRYVRVKEKTFLCDVAGVCE